MISPTEAFDLIDPHQRDYERHERDCRVCWIVRNGRACRTISEQVKKMCPEGVKLLLAWASVWTLVHEDL